ncbi:hypothetical protein TruAng_001194 [Truncatella angustata]|nr:hypothetical protein TruAng_001194 [Truncatella angustata]
MYTFHPFPRLPLELRRSIWEMSVEPRVVVINKTVVNGIAQIYGDYFWSPTRVPSALHACSESRSYLQNSYSKAFKTRTHPHYIWTDFDNDTIWAKPGYLLEIVEEWNSIRQLTIECGNFDRFWHYDMEDVRALNDTGLRTLTIIDMAKPSGKAEDSWWQDWSENLMVEFYYKCNPMPFYTRVIAPSDPRGIEVNTGNYINLYRSNRKAAEAADTDLVDLYESESEDGRERLFEPWEHTESCGCI